MRYLRAWQVGRAAAFVGALTWMATPKLFAHLGAGHVGLVESVAWLPWAVLAAHRLMEHRRVMDAVWLGAVWAMQFLADPRISFYSVALTVSYLYLAVGSSSLTIETLQTSSDRWCPRWRCVPLGFCRIERDAVAAVLASLSRRAIAAH